MQPETSDPTPGPIDDVWAVRRRRLLFRATHRGTYENDILIGGFVRARLDSFTAPEMDALEALMETPDAMLADWLTGRAPIPAEHDSAMMRSIRAAAEAGEARIMKVSTPEDSRA